MRTNNSYFITPLFALSLLMSSVSAQQQSLNRTPQMPTALTTDSASAQKQNSKSSYVVYNAPGNLKIGNITHASVPAGSKNFLFSFEINDMGNHQYVFYTDSNETVGYMMVNGLTIRLLSHRNGEHVPVFENDEYTVIINKTPATAEVAGNIEKMGEKEGRSYTPLQGHITFSDTKGDVIVKPFVGAEITMN